MGVGYWVSYSSGVYLHLCMEEPEAEASTPTFLAAANASLRSNVAVRANIQPVPFFCLREMRDKQTTRQQQPVAVRHDVK